MNRLFSWHGVFRTLGGYTSTLMQYTLDGSKIILEINRTDIVDISTGDVININGFEGVSYRWTEHDSDFMENNPDADIFLELERRDGQYRATGILLK